MNAENIVIGIVLIGFVSLTIWIHRLCIAGQRDIGASKRARELLAERMNQIK